MATAHGIIKIVGTLGDITFYFRDGKYLARCKGGGFNTKAIKTKPSYARVRENASEFGMCAKAAQFFRRAFGPHLSRPYDADLCPRTVKLMLDITKCDSASERGSRRPDIGILTDEGKRLLHGFEMNLHASLPQLLKRNYSFDSETRIFTITKLHPARIAFPDPATTASVKLLAISTDLKGLSRCVASEEVYIEKLGNPVDISLVAPLPELENCIGFYCVQLQFYQRVDQELVVFDDAHYRTLTIITVL